MKIFIYPPSPKGLPERLRESFPEHEIFVQKELPEDAEVVVGNPPVDAAAQCPRLRLLQLRSAGTGAYPSLLASHPALKLCCATGAYGHAVSEHMLSSLLCLMKHLDGYARNQAARVWQDLGTARTIRGARVLVIGMGSIGGEFAKAVNALGARVTGIRRAPSVCPPYAERVCGMEQLNALLPEADVIAMALPETAQTQNVMSRERFSLVKRGAYLLNAGRGSAIDEGALADALNCGALAGAALDVTSVEPLPEKHPLWSAKNLLITPHVSGGSHLPEIDGYVADIAVHNIRALLGQDDFISLVDPETGYRSR